ncbi:MAG: ArsI/CadI family heavy metal resistance metalloenzyme [Gammaproteobacteria bacterium]
MKRFHVHVAVDDLAASVRFYSAVFGQAPSVEKPEYAKWMLDEPRVNFAISHHARTTGLNHLGFQVDGADEMVAMRDQLFAADAGLVSEENAACCYARSDKYWVTDPTGIAWETFHTLDTAPIFGEPQAEESQVATAVCCSPQSESASACCVPAVDANTAACCEPLRDLTRAATKSRA